MGKSAGLQTKSPFLSIKIKQFAAAGVFRRPFATRLCGLCRVAAAAYFRYNPPLFRARLKTLRLSE
ncbi:hypothetical protein HMPREF9120_00560 [Neisseria sp. oral taxon 020 str. F0370]|nr:hypothetical protein HMPREF9120_00560 [Neisseria sp. oral taxon 020 str. F0370]